jgi:UDP-glucose 4-epimerase/UDP-arabinose 4-epimerase
MTQAVLVAGGAGYVGAHTCKSLARAGFLPIVLDNLSTGHREFVRWGPVVQADLHDTAAIADAISLPRSASFRRLRLCRRVGD